MCGSLPADTFGACLRALGFALDSEELRCVASLFPPREPNTSAAGASSASVDYEAFWEVAMERDASRGLQRVDARLREAVRRILEPAGADGLREAMAATYDAES